MSVKVIQGLSVTDSERVGGNGMYLEIGHVCTRGGGDAIHFREKYMPINR